MNEIAYADTLSWEEWQREYEYGAFYVFPPIGVIEPIDDLRRTYDPTSASYCRAHISLSEPLPRPITGSDLDELRARISAIDPFEIHYGPLRSFAPYPGVAYAIAPEDTFRELRSAIHSASMFKDTALKREHIAPHMTIAGFITAERTATLLQELGGHVPEGAFACHSVEYAFPNDDFYFERIRAIPLGKAAPWP